MVSQLMATYPHCPLSRSWSPSLTTQMSPPSVSSRPLPSPSQRRWRSLLCLPSPSSVTASPHLSAAITVTGVTRPAASGTRRRVQPLPLAWRSLPPRGKRERLTQERTAKSHFRFFFLRLWRIKVKKFSIMVYVESKGEKRMVNSEQQILPGVGGTGLHCQGWYQHHTSILLWLSPRQ